MTINYLCKVEHAIKINDYDKIVVSADKRIGMILFSYYFKEKVLLCLVYNSYCRTLAIDFSRTSLDMETKAAKIKMDRLWRISAYYLGLLRIPISDAIICRLHNDKATKFYDFNMPGAIRYARANPALLPLRKIKKQ